ncbi:MAG: sigma 54-interacting transcriptional regulator [Oscillospiraceae bacterium]|nr:sigma 54-interacting transcriptional regulator [Oscillospiraceae bacterium]
MTFFCLRQGGKPAILLLSPEQVIRIRNKYRRYEKFDKKQRLMYNTDNFNPTTERTVPNMSDNYRQAEQDLLFYVLDALPNPTVLLNRSGQTVYVNERVCPLDLSLVDFSAVPEVRIALSGTAQTSFRTELRGNGNGVSGTLELHHVQDEGTMLGALCIFSPDPAKEVLTIDSLPTASNAISAAWEKMQRISLLNTPALFMGEEGVGKTDFARALHRLSSKQKGEAPFVTVTPSDNPEQLLRAVSEAENGTLFCKRIDLWKGVLLQEASLLYASKRIAGDSGTVTLTARLMASSATDIAERQLAGEFPPDLYARMSLMPITIPPLRDRREDILPAAEKYVSAEAKLSGKKIQGFSEDSRKALLEYNWQGNVKELEKVVISAVRDCPGGLILPSYLGTLRLPGQGVAGGPLKKMRDAYGRDHIRSMLDIYGNSVAGKKKAAEKLGISLATLYRILGSKRS